MDLALLLIGVVALVLGIFVFFLATTTTHALVAAAAVVAGAIFVVGGLVLMEIDRVVAAVGRLRKPGDGE